jgi:tetratricopeptide (TPR) repeat protein
MSAIKCSRFVACCRYEPDGRSVRAIFDRAQLEARIAACDRVLAGEVTAGRSVLAEPAASARVEKGRALLELGRIDDAQRCLGAAVQDFCQAGAEALAGHARACGVAGADALIERLSSEAAGSNELQVGHAMALKAWLLAERGREPQELAALEELLERFPASGEPELRARVALALREKAWWLLDMGDVPGALGTGDELIARLTGETDPRVQRRIAQALLRHASTLLHQNRSPRRLAIVSLTAATALAGALRDVAGSPRVTLPPSLAILPATISRVFGPARNGRHELHTGPRQAAARAVRYRMLRYDQALEVCDLLVARFAHSTDPAERRLVATARVERASALLCLGRPRAGLSTMIRATESGEPAVGGFGDLAEQARRRRGPTTHVAAAAYDFARVLATDAFDVRRQTSALNTFIEQHKHERSLHTRLIVLAARGLRRSAGR